MSAFSSTRYFAVNPEHIPELAYDLVKHFQDEEYEVQKEDIIGGGAFISVTKGGLFKSAIGMKLALKIFLSNSGNGVKLEAGVGVFGQQVVPSALALFLFWPVILTQVWGIIKQSKLDDQAVEVVERSITQRDLGDNNLPVASTSTPISSTIPDTRVKGAFCTECGSRAKGKFCAECGTKLS